MKIQLLAALLTSTLFFSCKNEEKPCPTGNDVVMQARADSLDKREMDLAAREKALAEREASGSTSVAGDTQTPAQSGAQQTVASYNGADNSAANKGTKGAGNASGNNESRVAYKKVKTSTPGQYPEASERLLAEKDVQFQTAWGKKVMLNEIYARHGMAFKDAALRNHFNKESWYKAGKGKVTDKNLSAIERQNAAFIRGHQ